MPPKQRITRDKILNCGFEILKKDGISYINARSIAKKLNCSTQPIFSCFSSMDELKQILIEMASDCYSTYLQEGMKKENGFKQSGIAYIRFAKEEPKLFSLLFMNSSDFDVHTSKGIDTNHDLIITKFQELIDIPKEDADRLFLNIWIFTHGIATMVCTRTVNFTDKEIDVLLSDIFIGSILKYKQDKEKK